MVEVAVSIGNRVPDWGAGTGSTGLLAGEKVGESGRLTLFDFSEGMLAVARKSATQDQMQERVDLKVGDTLDLPLADNSFDAVLSAYSICPVCDPAKAATELYRVTRPGGRIGIAHSTEPETPFVKWMADQVENIVWHTPSISPGCRSVAVLPTLEQLGCKTIFKKGTSECHSGHFWSVWQISKQHNNRFESDGLPVRYTSGKTAVQGERYPLQEDTMNRVAIGAGHTCYRMLP